MADGVPTLEEVRRQYQAAEARLTEIASAASELASVTEEVADVRAAAVEAADKLAACASALSETTGQLGEATDALRSIDPRDIARRLEAIDSATAAVRVDVAGLEERLVGMGVRLAVIETRGRRLFTLVIATAAILIALAVVGLVA